MSGVFESDGSGGLRMLEPPAPAERRAREIAQIENARLAREAEQRAQRDYMRQIADMQRRSLPPDIHSSYAAVLQRLGAGVDDPAVSVAPPPEMPPAPSSRAPEFEHGDLTEYEAVAAAAGVDTPVLAIERFKRFLVRKDWPVYDLGEVAKFMDAKAAREGQPGGWNWRPLRAKDIIDARWGREARNERDFDSHQIIRQPASDYYARGAAAVYDKVVPLHALKKVAAIEAEYVKAGQGDIAFFVCDYAPLPEFKADPFLLAVVPNPDVASGAGRFVIDVWDEPGFGLEAQLKSGL